MTDRSELPHARGTYPTIREVPRSERGSRSRMRENPPRASITIREGHNLDGRGRSRARDSPHRGPITTSRMVGVHVGRRASGAEALRPYARALVALALEVRAEGLALPGEGRSHGPLGKGGSRCVA